MFVVWTAEILDEVSLKSNWLISTRMPPKSTICPDILVVKHRENLEDEMDCVHQGMSRAIAF